MRGTSLKVLTDVSRERRHSQGALTEKRAALQDASAGLLTGVARPTKLLESRDISYSRAKMEGRAAQQLSVTRPDVDSDEEMEQLPPLFGSSFVPTKKPGQPFLATIQDEAKRRRSTNLTITCPPHAASRLFPLQVIAGGQAAVKTLMDRSAREPAYANMSWKPRPVDISSRPSSSKSLRPSSSKSLRPSSSSSTRAPGLGEEELLMNKMSSVDNLQSLMLSETRLVTQRYFFLFESNFIFRFLFLNFLLCFLALFS